MEDIYNDPQFREIVRQLEADGQLADAEEMLGIPLSAASRAREAEKLHAEGAALRNKQFGDALVGMQPDMEAYRENVKAEANSMGINTHADFGGGFARGLAGSVYSLKNLGAASPEAIRNGLGRGIAAQDPDASPGAMMAGELLGSLVPTLPVMLVSGGLGVSTAATAARGLGAGARGAYISGIVGGELAGQAAGGTLAAMAGGSVDDDPDFWEGTSVGTLPSIGRLVRGEHTPEDLVRISLEALNAAGLAWSIKNIPARGAKPRTTAAGGDEVIENAEWGYWEGNFRPDEPDFQPGAPAGKPLPPGGGGGMDVYTRPIDRLKSDLGPEGADVHSRATAWDYTIMDGVEGFSARHRESGKVVSMWNDGEGNTVFRDGGVDYNVRRDPDTGRSIFSRRLGLDQDAAAAREMKGIEGPRRRPRGEPTVTRPAADPSSGRPAKETQQLVHFSKSDAVSREGVKTEFAGTGHAGEERGAGLKAVHFYRPGIKPEPTVASAGKTRVDANVNAAILDLGSEKAASILRPIKAEADRLGIRGVEARDYLNRELVKRGWDGVEERGFVQVFRDIDPAEIAMSRPLVPGDQRALQSAPLSFEGESAIITPSPTGSPPGTPNPLVRRYSQDYVRDRGLGRVDEGLWLGVSPERGRAIAELYDKLEHAPNDPKVKASYRAFIKETKDQFEFLRQRGVVFEPWRGEGQPYANSAEMTRDVQDNNHLYFFLTEDGFGDGNTLNHPLLGDSGVTLGDTKLTHNDLFRAVHDYFGHAKEGYTFGPRGEDNAWRSHVQMYSPAARGAMSFETRGQNSWVNYGPMGEQNRANPGNTVYAEQKANILPDEFMDTGEFNALKPFDPTKPAEVDNAVSRAMEAARAEIEMRGADLVPETQGKLFDPIEESNAASPDYVNSLVHKYKSLIQSEDQAALSAREALRQRGKEVPPDPHLEGGVEYLYSGIPIGEMLRALGKADSVTGFHHVRTQAADLFWQSAQDRIAATGPVGKAWARKLNEVEFKRRQLLGQIRSIPDAVRRDLSSGVLRNRFSPAAEAYKQLKRTYVSYRPDGTPYRTISYLQAAVENKPIVDGQTRINAMDHMNEIAKRQVMRIRELTYKTGKMAEDRGVVQFYADPTDGKVRTRPFKASGGPDGKGGWLPTPFTREFTQHTKKILSEPGSPDWLLLREAIAQANGGLTIKQAEHIMNGIDKTFSKEGAAAFEFTRQFQHFPAEIINKAGKKILLMETDPILKAENQATIETGRLAYVEVLGQDANAIAASKQAFGNEASQSNNWSSSQSGVAYLDRQTRAASGLSPYPEWTQAVTEVGDSAGGGFVHIAEIVPQLVNTLAVTGSHLMQATELTRLPFQPGGLSNIFSMYQLAARSKLFRRALDAYGKHEAAYSRALEMGGVEHMLPLNIRFTGEASLQYRHGPAAIAEQVLKTSANIAYRASQVEALNLVAGNSQALTFQRLLTKAMAKQRAGQSAMREADLLLMEFSGIPKDLTAAIREGRITDEVIRGVTSRASFITSGHGIGATGQTKWQQHPILRVLVPFHTYFRRQAKTMVNMIKDMADGVESINNGRVPPNFGPRMEAYVRQLAGYGVAGSAAVIIQQWLWGGVSGVKESADSSGEFLAKAFLAAVGGGSMTSAMQILGFGDYGYRGPPVVSKAIDAYNVVHGRGKYADRYMGERIQEYAIGMVGLARRFDQLAEFAEEDTKEVRVATTQYHGWAKQQPQLARAGDFIREWDGNYAADKRKFLRAIYTGQHDDALRLHARVLKSAAEHRERTGKAPDLSQSLRSSLILPRIKSAGLLEKAEAELGKNVMDGLRLHDENLLRWSSYFREHKDD